MKRLLFIALLLSALICCSKHSGKKGGMTASDSTMLIPDTIYSNGLKFSEGTIWYKDRLLISNYGGTDLDPINANGKGYIAQLLNGKLSVLIPPDGNLNSPKGMAILDDYLFIADVNMIVVYNLNDLKKKPQIISLPEGEFILSNLAFKGNDLYITVNNTGSIYLMTIENPAELSRATADLYFQLTGANGICIKGDSMFVTTYPANDSIYPVYSIYLIPDINNPRPFKLVDAPGFYNGIAYDVKREFLYFNDWQFSQIGFIDMKTHKTHLIYPIDKMIGPGDMTLHDDKLYVPDMPESKVYVFSVGKLLK